MANWCYNSLTIKGNPKEVQKFIEEAVGYNIWEKLTKNVRPPSPCKLQFNNHIPFPPGLIRAHTYKEKMTENEISLLYSDLGYNWETKNWGCKWGACYVNLEYEKGKDTAHYTFKTPWTPPNPWFEIVAILLYPTLDFTLSYEEERQAYKGERISKQGTITTNNHKKEIT